MLQQAFTGDQQRFVNRLAAERGINPGGVLFLESGEPWLKFGELARLAREKGEFREIAASYDGYIPELRQLVYQAQVTCNGGTVFSRTGVATIGERFSDGREADPHALAATRALRSTLSLAGFDPLPDRASTRMSIEYADSDDGRAIPYRQEFAHRNGYDPVTLDGVGSPPRAGSDAGDTADRASSSRTILNLAHDVRLIVNDGGFRDNSKYRRFLQENFGVETCAHLNRDQRKEAIRLLEDLARIQKEEAE